MNVMSGCKQDSFLKENINSFNRLPNFWGPKLNSTLDILYE